MSGGYWCPRCLAVTDGEHPCPACGLPQQGQAPARLRLIAHRLHELETERQALRIEQGELLLGLAPGAPPAATAERPAKVGPRPARGEWRTETIRDVLLWVGAGLLVVAAGIFAAFAWRRLDDTGRAALLLAATVLTSAGTAVARTKLAATAEALSAVALGLVIVDWFALRRAGVAENLDLALWWALGSWFVALVAAMAGRSLRSPRALSTGAAGVAGILVVASAANSPAAAAAGLAIVAAALITGSTWVRRLAGWTLAAGIADTIALIVYVNAVGFAVAAVTDTGPASNAAAAIALLAIAPGSVRALRPVVGEAADAMTALSTVALVAAAGVLQWEVFDGSWPFVAVGAIGATVTIAGLFAPADLRVGVVAGGLCGMAVGVVALSDVLSSAAVGPFGEADAAWSATSDTTVADWLAAYVRLEAAGAAIAVVMLAALVGVAGALRWRGQARAVGFGIAIVGIAAAVDLLPLAASTTVSVAAAVTGLGALVALGIAAFVPKRAANPVGSAAMMAVPAFGWALATDMATLVFLASLGAASGVAAIRSVGEDLRRVLATAAGAAFVGLMGSAAAAAGGTSETAGLVAAGVAGAVLAVGTYWRAEAADGPALELAALVGMAVGLALAGSDDTNRALAFTVVAAAMAVAGARPDRRPYLFAATALGLAASWSWLDVANVVLPEAYTAPAAVAAFVAGALHRNQDRSAGSWTAFGPGLVLALGPSLVLAVDEGGAVRPTVLAAAAVVSAGLGGTMRLQAPLVVGAVTLVVLAVATLAPAAAAIPRWLSIGIAGGLLVFFGATADRRTQELRRLGDRFSALEPRRDPRPAP